MSRIIRDSYFSSSTHQTIFSFIFLQSKYFFFHKNQNFTFSVVLCPTCKTSPFIGRNLALERISRSLFASAKWCWILIPDLDPWSWILDPDHGFLIVTRSMFMMTVFFGKVIPDLDDHHIRRNSQVITKYHIDHHQLQYPRAKELKIWENVDEIFNWKTSRSKYDLYADSGPTQQNYRERRVLHVPCNSRRTSYVVHGTSTSYHAILTSLVSSPASDGRRHGTRNFAS